jgi:general secretion pathway protein N
MSRPLAMQPFKAISQRAQQAPWAWAGAGALLGLLTTLILQAPAAWLASAIGQSTDGKLLLSEARGTVWSGSARLQLSGGAGSRDLSALPGRVAWRLRPQALGLSVALEADCCTREPITLILTPAWGGGKLQVLDNDSARTQPTVWPAAMLSGLGAPWNTMQVEGELSLSTQGLSVEWSEGRPLISGSAELLASNMSSRLSTLKPMGSYRITLHGGTTATLEITTLDGSLQVAGTGRWVGSRLRFEGEASAAPEREAALSNLLNIIGRRSGARSIITLG